MKNMYLSWNSEAELQAKNKGLYKRLKKKAYIKGMFALKSN